MPIIDKKNNLIAFHPMLDKKCSNIWHFFDLRQRNKNNVVLVSEVCFKKYKLMQGIVMHKSILLALLVSQMESQKHEQVNFMALKFTSKNRNKNKMAPF